MSKFSIFHLLNAFTWTFLDRRSSTTKKVINTFILLIEYEFAYLQIEIIKTKLTNGVM